MESKQPSSFIYLALGAVPIGASLVILYILFASGIFKVTFNNDAALLLVGTIYGISLFGIIALLYKWHEGPERARAMQSHLVLTIANETISHLRRGFSAETCEKVAQIVMQSSDVDAMAITNKKSILGFAGFGREHYQPEKYISSREMELEEDNIAFFQTSVGNGQLEKEGEVSWNVVSVPLKVQRKMIGTLDFLYNASKRIGDNRIAVAKGLGHLLSTQLELSELENQQALAFRAELKALRAQINPHFLFNTLNTIAALCRTDPKNAREMLISFADFFRESLERQSQFTTLDEEMKYVNSYLVFEKARFGSKLEVDRRIDKSARKIKMPSLMIQPLVENAIKHGMDKDGRLTLTLKARVDNGNLVVSVKDNGKGMVSGESMVLPASDSKGLGIGLANIKDRMWSLYGSAGQMNVQSAVGRGTQVTLRIPVQGGRNEG